MNHTMHRPSMHRSNMHISSMYKARSAGVIVMNAPIEEEFIEDSNFYSCDRLDEAVDDDCISAEECGFMSGYISEDDYEDYDE